ncbi:MAG: hypothetical protein PWQ31_1400 [Eubacteriales bacterium]|nr:hypothetical protein [Eubacteriales bacterium]
MARYRLEFTKKGSLRFISHLDLQRLLERLFRRAGLPLTFSAGFNPRPRLSLAAPLPLGIEGLRECGEFELEENLSPREVVGRIAPFCPPGMEVKGLGVVRPEAEPVMAAVNTAAYVLYLRDTGQDTAANAAIQLMQKEQLPVRRKGKDGKEKEVDIRPGLYKVEVKKGEMERETELFLLVDVGKNVTVRPEDVVQAGTGMGLEAEKVKKIVRSALYVKENGDFLSPLDSKFCQEVYRPEK